MGDPYNNLNFVIIFNNVSAADSSKLQPLQSVSDILGYTCCWPKHKSFHAVCSEASGAGSEAGCSAGTGSGLETGGY